MICAELDIGSRTIKLVVGDADIRYALVLDTGPNPLRRCQEILSGRSYERQVATGYGRHLVASVLGSEVVSEIRAYAIGARHLYAD